MDHVEIGGLRIAYERAGSGPPLVLVHGYVGDGPTTWRHQLDDLSRDFTVVAWDAPGAGQSSDPPESFGVADYGDCLASFVTTLKLEHPHIAGLSFGGALALALYDRHPALPKTLILASAYAGWRGSLPPEVAEARLTQAMRLAELSPTELVDTLLPTMFASPVAPADVAAFRASMASFHPTGFRALARASAEDLGHVPSKVAIPTLVVCGSRDERAPLPVAEALRVAIPNATLVVLDGVGHACNIEAPERFNAEVRAFLGRWHPLRNQ